MFKSIPLNKLFVFVSLSLLCSCGVYKQDIMFKLDKNFSKEDLAVVTEDLDRNYILQPNDNLLLDVFTNNGERLIDPNNELNTGQMGMQQAAARDRFQYIVQINGVATFPIVGDMKVAGLSIFEAELALAEKFNAVYKDSFVKLRINNRRVFVLGAPGGQVVPIPNENTSLIEILATAGGVQFGAKAHNIRLIRGDEVFLVDLSTVSGMMKTELKVASGDVIYIEPWRRPWLETLRDVSPALSLVSSVLTLIIVVQNL